MSALPAEIARPTSSRWTAALLSLGLLWLAILFVYRDTAVSMVGIWYRSETFTHAFLVPPMSAWLVWRQRDVLRLLEPRAAPWVLVAMVPVAVLWLLGDLSAVNAATHLALVAMLVLAVPAVLGLEVTRAILFPLGFMFFCVPIGEFLLPVLMEYTADFTVAALQFTGIPVYREGLRFVIPSGSWSVVEACSGVRYLIASLMVGSLFAYLNYRTMWRRWVFVGVSIVVPIIANWLRAYMIVMIGHLSNNQLAVGVDHLVYGWVFFGIVIMLMFVIGARWAEDPATPDESAAASQRAAGSAAGSAGTLAVTASLALLLLASPQGVLRAIAAANQPGVPLVSLPAEWPGGWTRADEAAPKWEPRFVEARAKAQGWYRQGADGVGVYLAYYRAQDYTSKLVSGQNVLVMSQDLYWHQVASRAREVSLADGRRLVVREAELLATGGAAGPPPLTVWMIYWVDDRFIASDVRAKFAGIAGRLAGRGDDGAALLVYAPGHGEAAEHMLNKFLSANLGALQGLLRAVRADSRS